MQTQYKCSCGSRLNIESQGDLPIAVTVAPINVLKIGDKEYPLVNHKGENLKSVLDGIPVYWTPPAPLKPESET